MVQFVGTQILMENTWSVDHKDFRDHFKFLRKSYNLGISLHRFELIRQRIIPTNDEIRNFCSILMENSAKYVIIY